MIDVFALYVLFSAKMYKENKIKKKPNNTKKQLILFYLVVFALYVLSSTIRYKRKFFKNKRVKPKKN